MSEDPVDTHIRLAAGGTYPAFERRRRDHGRRTAGRLFRRWALNSADQSPTRDFQASIHEALAKRSHRLPRERAPASGTMISGRFIPNRAG